jgi:hypothetical protein
MRSCACVFSFQDGSCFHHPNPVAISRLTKFVGESPELLFNYRSPETVLWENSVWQNEYGYRIRYAETDDILPSNFDDGAEHGCIGNHVQIAAQGKRCTEETMVSSQIARHRGDD